MQRDLIFHDSVMLRRSPHNCRIRPACDWVEWMQGSTKIENRVVCDYVTCIASLPIMAPTIPIFYSSELHLADSNGTLTQDSKHRLCIYESALLRISYKVNEMSSRKTREGEFGYESRTSFTLNIPICSSFKVRSLTEKPDSVCVQCTLQPPVKSPGFRLIQWSSDSLFWTLNVDCENWKYVKRTPHTERGARRVDGRCSIN